MKQIESLYKVQNRDITKAGVVLADAFQHDPVWVKIFEDVDNMDYKHAFFESPVRYCLRHGKVYATSEHLEGIAAYVPGNLADMTFWRLIQSGFVGAGIKKGMKFMIEMGKYMKKIETIFKPLEVDRNANMEGRKYVYLMIVGVASEFQEQGFGGKLLKAIIEENEQARIPIYLETETKRNVRMYEKMGFKSINQIILPVIDLPQWEMVREPGKE